MELYAPEKKKYSVYVGIRWGEDCCSSDRIRQRSVKKFE
jgi:tRNA(Ile)-lysidine synthase TilS/MesJ